MAHAKAYTDLAVERFHLNKKSLVVELASNDGYLLQFFVQKGIPVLGIEPTANVAEEARKKGIPTLVKFFGREMAADLACNGKQADLVVGNNVLCPRTGSAQFCAGDETFTEA